MLPLQCGNSKNFRWGGGTSPSPNPSPCSALRASPIVLRPLLHPSPPNPRPSLRLWEVGPDGEEASQLRNVAYLKPRKRLKAVVGSIVGLPPALRAANTIDSFKSDSRLICSVRPTLLLVDCEAPLKRNGCVTAPNKLSLLLLLISSY